jgi:transposase
MRTIDGLSFRDIHKALEREGKSCSVSGIRQCVRRYLNHGSHQQLYGGGRKNYFRLQHLDFIDKVMTEDNETTAQQLADKFREEFGWTRTRSTFHKLRYKLGWRYSATKYCQIVSDRNKVKRFEFALKCLAEHEEFSNVIFSDETKIQMECNAKRQYHKKSLGVQHRLRGVPKHPDQIYAWAGISMLGATKLHCFVGNMDASYYQSILRDSLKPFIQYRFGDRPHRFQQDNDPKHCANTTKEFMKQNGINWWPTPAQSPVSNNCNM